MHYASCTLSNSARVSLWSGFLFFPHFYKVILMSDYTIFLYIITFYNKLPKLNNYFKIKRDNFSKYCFIVALLIGISLIMIYIVFLINSLL